MGLFGKEIVSVIGIGNEEVILLTVGVKKGKFELLQYIKEQISKEAVYTEEGEGVSEGDAKREQLARSIESAFKRMKYKPSFFVLTVPAEYSIVRTLSIPFKGAKKVNSVLKFELEPHIPFPIEELKLDYFVAYEGKKETDILVLGVRDMYISENVSVLEEFSVKPECAIIDSLGLVYLWSKSGKNQQGLRAGLIIDRDFSVFVVAKNFNLVFLRHIFMGREGFHNNPDAFAREVQNSVRSFLAKWKGEEDKIEVIDLWGVPLSEGELEVFSKIIKLSVNLVDISGFVVNKCKELNEEELSNLFRMIGVVGLATDPKISFNLLKDGQNLSDYLPLISKQFIFTNCLVLMGMVIFAFLFRQMALANLVQAKLCESEAESITQEMEQISAEKGLDENVDLSVFFTPPFVDVLSRIGEIFPSDKVDITEIRLAPPDNQGWWIRIQGKTRDSSFINVAISKLREVEYFDVVDEPELSAQGDLTSFAIKVQRRESSSNEGGAGKSGEDKLGRSNLDDQKVE